MAWAMGLAVVGYLLAKLWAGQATLEAKLDCLAALHRVPPASLVVIVEAAQPVTATIIERRAVLAYRELEAARLQSPHHGMFA